MGWAVAGVALAFVIVALLLVQEIFLQVGRAIQAI